MIKNILFDFDGVILDSMPIRDYGFKKIFEDYDDDLVNKFLKYHNRNGGLSRYVKIKYFYNKLLKQEISEEKIIFRLQILYWPR
jgi:beta-phosphoglucomutase-like phosphatase (HAD superfamily)